MDDAPRGVAGADRVRRCESLWKSNRSRLRTDDANSLRARPDLAPGPGPVYAGTMSASAKKRPGPATVEVLLAMPEEERYELVDGVLVPKEAARGPHGRAQLNVGASLSVPFGRRDSGGPPDRPGGWWLATEVLVRFTPEQVRRPDVAGWRRERMPAIPDDSPIQVVPDWICEVVSPTNPGNDTITKMGLYHRAEVRHYWLLDPQAETLAVYRWTQDGYLYVLGARRGDRVRAEPFDAVELPVGVFFGDDEV